MVERLSAGPRHVARCAPSRLRSTRSAARALPFKRLTVTLECGAPFVPARGRLQSSGARRADVAQPGPAGDQIQISRAHEAALARARRSMHAGYRCTRLAGAAACGRPRCKQAEVLLSEASSLLSSTQPSTQEGEQRKAAAAARTCDLQHGMQAPPRNLGARIAASDRSRLALAPAVAAAAAAAAATGAAAATAAAARTAAARAAAAACLFGFPTSAPHGTRPNRLARARVVHCAAPALRRASRRRCCGGLLGGRQRRFRCRSHRSG